MGEREGMRAGSGVPSEAILLRNVSIARSRRASRWTSTSRSVAVAPSRARGSSGNPSGRGRRDHRGHPGEEELVGRDALLEALEAEPDGVEREEPPLAVTRSARRSADRTT